MCSDVIDMNCEVDFAIKCQWEYCDCNNGNKTFGIVWTTRHCETSWRQKGTPIEKTTGQRHALLVGPPIGDDMSNCRGELRKKFTFYFVENIKIGKLHGFKFGLRVNFYFCVKGKCLIPSLCYKFPLLIAVYFTRPPKHESCW